MHWDLAAITMVVIMDLAAKDVSDTRAGAPHEHVLPVKRMPSVVHPANVRIVIILVGTCTTNAAFTAPSASSLLPTSSPGARTPSMPSAIASWRRHATRRSSAAARTAQESTARRAATRYGSGPGSDFVHRLKNTRSPASFRRARFVPGAHVSTSRQEP